MEELQNLGFCAQRSNAGTRGEWLGLNVRTLMPAGDWRRERLTFERAFRTFERSRLRVLGARCQAFERTSQTFERLTTLACWPGLREFELSPFG